LTTKTQRQDAAVTSQPPTSGPTTKAIPVHAVQAPIAAPRSSPLNVAAMTASPEGVRIAPATPCSPRATISVGPSGAAPQARERMPKATMPARKTRRAPKRSPSEPPTSSSDPSVSRYASTTHCCSARPPPRSRWIAGSATLTTVESTKTTIEPRMQATRTRRFRVSGARRSILAGTSAGAPAFRPVQADPRGAARVAFEERVRTARPTPSP
jgi:hypothetical protein